MRKAKAPLLSGAYVLDLLGHFQKCLTANKNDLRLYQLYQDYFDLVKQDGNLRTADANYQLYLVTNFNNHQKFDAALKAAE